MAAGRTSTHVRESLHREGFEVDYVVDSDGRRFGAVTIDGVRLIDNVPLNNDEE